MDFFNLLINRRSERNYQEKEIEKEKIEKIFKVINSSPTSTNSQDFSCIVVNDKKIRTICSLGLETQKHIIEAPLFLIFCADLNRVKHISEVENSNSYFNSYNKLLTAAGDAFISASFASNVAISLGLGTCFIGIIRQKITELKKELKLEGQIVPIIGLTIGYIKNQFELKPKINHIYQDQYDLTKVKNETENYNIEMLNYYDKRSGTPKNSKWSNAVLKYFNSEKSEVDDVLKSTWNIK